MLHVWFDSIYTKLGLVPRVVSSSGSSSSNSGLFGSVPVLNPIPIPNPNSKRIPHIPPPFVRKNAGHSVDTSKDGARVLVQRVNGWTQETLTLSQLYHPVHCYVHFYAFLETIGSIAAQICREQGEGEASIYLLTLYNYARIGDVEQYRKKYLSCLECPDELDEYAVTEPDLFEPLCAKVHARFAVDLEILCNSVLVVLADRAYQSPGETNRLASVVIRSKNHLVALCLTAV